MGSIIVTGSAGGIGRAICEQFHEAGYRVLGLDRVEDTCAYETWVLDLRAIAAPDLEGDHARNGLAPRLNAWCGDGLDVLLHNAAHQVVNPLKQLSAQDWYETLAVNLTAPFFLTQQLEPLLIARKGLVLAISSIHAKLTKPGFSAYAASKGALNSWIQAIALDLAPEVRALGIAPAAINTPMLREGFAANPAALQELAAYHPVARIGEPNEIARLALFLASDQARFMTGSIIEINGGIGHLLHDPC